MFRPSTSQFFCSIAAASDISARMIDTESLVHQKFTGRFSGPYGSQIKTKTNPVPKSASQSETQNMHIGLHPPRHVLDRTSASLEGYILAKFSIDGINCFKAAQASARPRQRPGPRFVIAQEQERACVPDRKKEEGGNVHAKATHPLVPVCRGSGRSGRRSSHSPQPPNVASE